MDAILASADRCAVLPTPSDVGWPRRRHIPSNNGPRFMLGMLTSGGEVWPMCCSGRSNKSKHGGRLPRLQGIENRAWQPVLQVAPTAPESAIERTRSGTERRDRTTTVALVPAAQNGTSGVPPPGSVTRTDRAQHRPICLCSLPPARDLQTAQTLSDAALGPTKSTGHPLVGTARRSRLGGTPGLSALPPRSKKSRACASRSSSGEAFVYVPVTPKLPSAWPA